MGEMTLADIAAVTDRDNNAFGGNNGGMWIFATDDDRQRAGGFDVFEMPQNFNGGRKRGGIHAGKPARKEPGWALERVEA